MIIDDHVHVSAGCNYLYITSEYSLKVYSLLTVYLTNNMFKLMHLPENLGEIYYGMCVCERERKRELKIAHLNFMSFELKWL